MGLRSYLSAGLGWAGRPLGALNLSSRDGDGFSQLDEGILALFTSPAAAVIVVASRYSEARDLAAQLEQALRSRAVIDQAIGIVMAESRCDADQAFRRTPRVRRRARRGRPARAVDSVKADIEEIKESAHR